MKPKLHAVTYGKDDKPSVRHRFIAGLDYFRNYFEVTWSPSFSDERIDLLCRGDVLLVQKRIPKLSWTWWRSRRSEAKIAYDFDDAMWTSALGDSFARRWRTNLRLRSIIYRADLVTVANAYLADWARNTGADPLIVPMGIELPPIAEPGKASGPILFGWGGHPQSQYLLQSISPALQRFFSNRRDCRFVVMSGKQPNLPFEFDWWPFDAENENRFFSSIDVGLVPSTRSDFDRGKSPIKILQHFANARPVVTDGVGATRELVDPSTGWLADGTGDLSARWEKALVAAAMDTDGRLSRGRAGRRRIEERHSKDHVFKTLTAALVSLSEEREKDSKI
ncbi:glycosyltransferase [Neorhizobium sp. CSC1952]|uniref:glycosyltransferase n=1 Tax=Neorhizobium sp. CSC1952 TaxID=2978974 RepID=UPI0025A5D45A|nr:glycosyltransferase [Rhizobium sp. CSC1952]WJR66043.1 glycosyltransferase [Rhizobium sp. CSC1952]